MATTEALAFLNWLQENAKQNQCLEQGKQWPQWASSEGFNPDAILAGLFGMDQKSDQKRNFQDFIGAPEGKLTAFTTWISSLLLCYGKDTAYDLSGLAGGANKKPSLIEAKLQHHTQRLYSEAFDSKEFLELKAHTTKTYDYRNDSTSYSFLGSRGDNGEITFESAPNWKTVSGYFNYNQRGKHISISGRYDYDNGESGSITIFGLDKTEYIDPTHNPISKKDASLLATVTNIEERTTNRVEAIKQILGADLDQRTRNLVLETKEVTNFKSLHASEYDTAKAVLAQFNQVDLSSLNKRQKIDIFVYDREAVQIISTNVDGVQAKKAELRNRVITAKEKAAKTLQKIETIQTIYKDSKHEYSIAKAPVEDYTALFARQRGNTDQSKNYHLVHYYNYNNQIKYSKSHASNGNYDYGENYAKRRASLVAKREELFGRSEAHAIQTASSTYQLARKQGLSNKVCLDMAVDSYLKSIASEDIDFLRKRRNQFETDKAKWESMSYRKKSMYLDDPTLMNGRRDKDIARDVGDVLLSVGADILQRQIDVAKKAWTDQQDRFSALRLEMLVSRLTLEFSMAERYDKWYARHPTEQYHPVKKWFAQAWADIWDTLTLPYRVVAAEIKGWKSGDTFWQGMKAGMDVEGKFLHQDIHGINHMIKGFQRLVAPAFTWIPGVKKFVDFEDLVGRAVESIPQHIVKNVTGLGKQLWKIVTLQFTWKGIWDGLGRDTRGIRHLVRHIDWLAHDVFTGNFSNIGSVISKDFNTAKKGVRIYLDRAEIKRAIVIKHDELHARRILHRHFHHIVKSPMRVIADDMTYNLKNDKAFAELRSKLKGTRKGTQAAKLYKEARSLTSGLRSIDKDLHNQYANLTTKQKVKLMQDYSNHDLMEKVIDYELATTVGANLTNSIKKFRATAEGLSIDASSVAKTVQDDVSSMITKFHNAIYANLTGIQKQAQHWILAGGLIDWAKAVNENFKNDTKKGIKFLKSPSSKSFKAKAFKSYLHYKEQTILDAFKKDEAEEIKAKDPIFYNNLARDRRDMLRGYKDYRIEKTYFKRQWQAWGRSDGKTALTAYDITFSVHFDVNTTTTPPKVTCTSLSKSEEKKQNNTIRTKKVGDRLFMRLMWTQLLLQLFEGNSPKAVSRRDRFIKYDVNADRIASGIGKGLGALEAKFKASPKISVFFSSHILLRDLIKLEHAFETPKRVFTRINQEFKRVNKAIQRESDFIKLLRQPVSVFSKKNFFRIESYKTNSLKILKLQAALAFDFDDTINNKGVKQIDTSRYDYMKKQAKSQDHTLSADYKKDMGAERAGDNLTIGQVLVSLEPGSTKDLGPVSEPTRNSSHSINNSVPSNNPVPKKGKFWKKLPQQKASNPADKKTATANLMLLWRNYKLVKHLSNKKSKAKELDDTAAKKADDDGLDFDSLTSQEIDTASRRVNREATRLDDDFDYLKGEFEVDEKAAENAIEAETEAIENQVLYEAEHGVVDKSDDLLPNNNILESARVETEEFGNSVIETTKKGKEYIGEDIEATEGEAALEAGAAEDIVGEAVML